ncbi:hypothetical protein SPHINGO391_520187 [Sphingomonas aurantiaca]|uniref:Uncharacterized protein n=1 Tax=Sphingomonas aurantiaca TaxID=185949 RepID=A0A5E8APQ5_9SPHN|nr:hypothetical protein SPHINGO391_520187 [Sphingomonas aurantiaca]
MGDGHALERGDGVRQTDRARRQVAEGRFGAYHWPGPAELLRRGRGQALHCGADRRRLRDPRQGFGGPRLIAVGAAYRRPFPPSQFQLDGLAQQVSLTLAWPQDGFDATKRSFRKARERLVLHWRATD